MIGVGSRVRLKRSLSNADKQYWREKGISSVRIYTVSKQMRLPSGIICLLKGTGQFLYEEELEDMFISNLKEILT